MDDLISRQAAIDKADSLYRDTKNDECYMITGYNHAISDIRAILKSLPSAQPERCEDCGNFNKPRLLIPQPERKKRSENGGAGMNSKERKALEDGGLIYRKSEPIIVKTDRILTQEELLKLKKEFEKSGSSIILLPAGFDLAETPAKWIYKKDPDYSGGGYSQCENCGARFSWGAYHEPQEFRHCPMCGHRMEVEEDE